MRGMGLIALLLMVIGFLGTILSYFEVARYAYREHGQGWGLLCLLVPNVNILWGIIHWSEDESRKVFLKYLAYSGVFVFGLVLNGIAARGAGVD